MLSVTDIFQGSFILSPQELAKKLPHIKAYIFDWDGVFNDAHKSLDGTSSYSETDSMGVNLLRFTHYLQQGHCAPVAIISGEQNKVAFLLAQREHFSAVYYKIKHKETALLHFCKANDLQPSEVLFVFDDVLDFSAAKIAGLRIMVDHSCNPLLVEYAKKSNLVDYLTSHDGQHGAVRESTELIMFLHKLFDKAIDHRAAYSKEYVAYLSNRNEQPTDFYTIFDNQITEQHPL
jgi:3-deoxy-D-manno-octulosonate 8-phosphate phosphatase (KDO 8-P phosphatase)